MNAINVVEHADGELRVSSEIIAQQTENQHKNVLGLIRTHEGALAEFGAVAFETRVGTRGGSPVQVAHLNEPQSTLLISFMRNSAIVVAFKLALVKEFYRMRRALAEMQPRGEQLLALAVVEAQRVLAEKDERIAELEPDANSWQQLADASGTYTVTDAGKLLASAGCDTGPRRLFQQLADMGWLFKRGGIWTGKQDKINAGYLAEYAGSHFHPRTGERVLDAPTVRVTIAGLGKLREFFGGAHPLEVFEVAS